MECKRINTDVLIIGGGVAGCAGAIAAAQHGQNVVLVEKIMDRWQRGLYLCYWWFLLVRSKASFS